MAVAPARFPNEIVDLRRNLHSSVAATSYDKGQQVLFSSGIFFNIRLLQHPDQVTTQGNGIA